MLSNTICNRYQRQWSVAGYVVLHRAATSTAQQIDRYLAVFAGRGGDDGPLKRQALDRSTA